MASPVPSKPRSSRDTRDPPTGPSQHSSSSRRERSPPRQWDREREDRYSRDRPDKGGRGGGGGGGRGGDRGRGGRDAARGGHDRERDGRRKGGDSPPPSYGPRGTKRTRSRSPTNGERPAKARRDSDRPGERERTATGGGGAVPTGPKGLRGSGKPVNGSRGGRDVGAVTNGGSAVSAKDKLGAKDVVEDGDSDAEDAALRRMMGFTTFRTTKNTKVPGNETNFGVRKEKVMVARQYMNRQGGFNRPLSPPR
jgi:U4/U6.U5 tri-snRNP-associated protein 3